MGCPAGTGTGYELTADLTFAATATWTPIGSFGATLDGAGHTITGLNISVSAITVDTGMFQSLSGGARIRDLGLVDASVTSTAGSGNRSNGILAGATAAGAALTSVYAQGGSISVISSTAGANVGGLVGYLRGDIYASYTTAAVTMGGSGGGRYVGGLAGRCESCTISASYAAGVIDGGAATFVAGRYGDAIGAGATVVASYCDIQVTGQAVCGGTRSGGALGANFAATTSTTAQLQAPTGYAGIYLNWNIDRTGDGRPDYRWKFGTASQYPRLNTPAERAAATPAPFNYDADGDNLIEIHNLAQLNTLRWDTDGDGRPASNGPAYSTVFGGHTVGMGCPAGCRGYELAAALTVPAATSSWYNPWSPILGYNAELDGNGRAITDLRVEHDDHAGLFATLGGSSTIRNLALDNPRVTITANHNSGGALVGLIPAGGAVIDGVSVRGGRIAVEHAATTTFHSFWVGGLAGWVRAGAAVSNSYTNTEVANTFPGTGFVRIGGLTGELDGRISNTYAAGRITTTGTASFAGGLLGVTSFNATSTASYCDTETSMIADCVRVWDPNFGASSTVPIAQTTMALQTPIGDTGIYRDWAPSSGATACWNFGTPTDYPVLSYVDCVTDAPPPGGPREAQPPQDAPYDPAADHPESYENARYEMAATCKVHRGADGAAVGSVVSFDLGSYAGAVILHLAVWNGEFFMSYESQGIAMPALEREGQSATVRVATDPGRTRFRVDSVSPTSNLVLGYADCHTDDPVADLAESAATSTAATPKVYVNERYEMTAACEVANNADGVAESSLIRFDLGGYRGDVLLSLSLWNGEYYASYESLGVDPAVLEREGQSAVVRVVTDPAETRFLLDGTPNGLRMNLVLGYADCHTAGE